MRRYVLIRVATSVLMLVATSVVIFVALRWLPGDPVLARIGTTKGVTQETIDHMRAELGLNHSLVSQYFTWVGGIFHGDFGTSYSNGFSVGKLIGQRIGVTIELTLVAVGLAILVAVPLAIIASLRPHGWLDRGISAISSVGMAFPPFVAAVFLLIIFSVELGWLPARGYVSLFSDPLENIRDMVLPAVATATVAAPLIIRYLRADLVAALNAPFVRTAEGKGVPRRRVVIRHALRNAMIPALTSTGLVFGYTLGGSVVIEYVFGLPGLGSLAVESALRRDYSVLQGVVILLCAFFIFTTLIVDLIGHAIDPRVRFGGRNG
jgi:peptide/nickel transport system permease protein